MAPACPSHLHFSQFLKTVVAFIVILSRKSCACNNAETDKKKKSIQMVDDQLIISLRSNSSWTDA
jgi:hypothetical protein